MARLHRERRRAAGEVAKLGRVTEQLGQRYVSMQLAPALVEARIQDLTPAAADVASQVAQVLTRSMDDHVHDWLQQDQAGARLCLLEALDRARLERLL